MSSGPLSPDEKPVAPAATPPPPGYAPAPGGAPASARQAPVAPGSPASGRLRPPEPAAGIPAQPPVARPPAPPQASSAIGRVVGKFQIVQELGGGAMGRVYRAIQQGMNRVVALKVMSARTSSDPSAIQRFIREAQSAARLNHPNIIQVYDVGQAGPVFYLAMEFVDGPTLQQLLKARGSIPPLEALDIIISCAEALEHAQGQGVIHRDLKPANIMINGRGIVKLADLGIAKLSGPFEGESSGVLTVEGAIVGSPFYMSPEQARDSRNVDQRTDYYSLGATFYHMVYGRVPLPAQTAMDAISRLLAEEPEFPATSSEVGIVVDVMKKMMAKDRENRHPTALALLDDLRHARNVLVANHPEETASSRLRRITTERSIPLEIRNLGVDSGLLPGEGEPAPQAATGRGRVPSDESLRASQALKGVKARPSARAGEVRPRRSPVVPLIFGVFLVAAAAGAWRFGLVGGPSGTTGGPGPGPGPTRPPGDGTPTPPDPLAEARNFARQPGAAARDVAERYRRVIDAGGAAAETARTELASLVDGWKTALRDAATDAETAFEAGRTDAARAAVEQAAPYRGIDDLAEEIAALDTVGADADLLARLEGEIRRAVALAEGGDAPGAESALAAVERDATPRVAARLDVAGARERVATERRAFERREAARQSLERGQIEVFRLARDGRFDLAEARAVGLQADANVLGGGADPLIADLQILRRLADCVASGLSRSAGQRVELRLSGRSAPLAGTLGTLGSDFRVEVEGGAPVRFRPEDLVAADFLSWARTGGATAGARGELVLYLFKAQFDDAARLLVPGRELTDGDIALFRSKLERFREADRADRVERARAASQAALDRADQAYSRGPAAYADARDAYREALRVGQEASLPLAREQEIIGRLDEIAQATGEPWRESQWAPLFRAPCFAWGEERPGEPQEIEVRYRFDTPGAAEALAADWHLDPIFAPGPDARGLTDYVTQPSLVPARPADLAQATPWQVTQAGGRTFLFGTGWDRLVWKGRLVGGVEAAVLFRARTQAGPTVLFGAAEPGRPCYLLAVGFEMPRYGPNLQRWAPGVHEAYRRLDRIIHGEGKSALIMEGSLFPDYQVLGEPRALQPSPGIDHALHVRVAPEAGAAALHIDLDGVSPIDHLDRYDPIRGGTVALGAQSAFLEIVEVRIRGIIDPAWAEDARRYLRR